DPGRARDTKTKDSCSCQAGLDYARLQHGLLTLHFAAPSSRSSLDSPDVQRASKLRDNRRFLEKSTQLINEIDYRNGRFGMQKSEWIDLNIKITNLFE